MPHDPQTEVRGYNNRYFRIILWEEYDSIGGGSNGSVGLGQYGVARREQERLYDRWVVRFVDQNSSPSVGQQEKNKSLSAYTADLRYPFIQNEWECKSCIEGGFHWYVSPPVSCHLHASEARFRRVISLQEQVQGANEGEGWSLRQSMCICEFFPCGDHADEPLQCMREISALLPWRQEGDWIVSSSCPWCGGQQL